MDTFSLSMGLMEYLASPIAGLHSEKENIYRTIYNKYTSRKQIT